MLKKNEPDWIEHDGSSECPVPAGHDVEVEYNWGKTYRCDNPELRDWTRITHYRDWTAFEQQQASAEVPKLLTEAGLRKILKEEGGVAGWRQDRIVRGFKARALLAPEPEPDALRDLAEELARESQDLSLPLNERTDWFEAALRERNLIAPEPEPVDPLVAALASIDIGLSDIELQKLKDMGVAVTAPARGEEA